MRTFAQMQNQPLKPVSSRRARPNMAAHPILRLQRAIGNQAMQGILQTNAEELKAGLTGTASPRFGHDFSRSPIHPPTAGAIQTKLTINMPGDEYEQEADRVAEQVMRMPKPQLQRAYACGGGCPKCRTEQVMSMTPATTPNVQHQIMERAKAQPNLLETLIRNAQATPATAPEATVQPKLTFGNQAETLSLIQRQTESLDDQGDCSSWETDCESFCIRAAKQYWLDVDGVQPPAVKHVDCSTPLFGPDGEPRRGPCIVSFEGGLRVSVGRPLGKPAKTLEIWRTQTGLPRGYVGPSCKYEYRCARDGSLILEQVSCREYQPQLPKQEQDESKISSPLQRSPAHQARFSQPPPIVPAVLNSPGQPLDPVTSAFMESRFGHGFSQVRVHTDSRAAQLAQSLNARALTVGRDVVVGAGQYAPQTFEGKRLIAHELTHVLQQSKEKSVIRRKIQFDSPNYIRANPIGRILREQPVGLTTPTVNSAPLPDNFMQAGELIFKALEPKQANYDPSTKECAFTDFAVNVSANVIIPTEPEGEAEGKKWTMNLSGSVIKGISACHKKETVPVSMTGKPSSEAAGKWIESNEQEHVDDLKKLYDKYLQPHFNWLLSLKAKGDDSKKCLESLMTALGKKGALVTRDFLKDWGESIKKRDEGGKHDLHNEVKAKDDCSRVEIKSSKK